MDGDEVVQLYLQIHDATVVVPHTQLVAFKRIRVAAGQTVDVSFTIDAAGQSVMRDPDFEDVVEPGARGVWIGGSSSPSFSPGVSFDYSVTGTAAVLVRECRHSQESV